MSKYDRFYPVAPITEEDTRPLNKWHKMAIGAFALVALWVWLTPDFPALPEQHLTVVEHYPHGLLPCQHSRDPKCWKEDLK